jgi:hypothetical protein
MTDQFDIKFGATPSQTQDILPRLKNEYKRIYYAGIICERHAKAALKRETPHAGYIAYDYFREAMNWYEKAEKKRPPKNEESILRWNACVRMIMKHILESIPQEEGTPPLLDV